ncbi:uncharacterized protein LOC121998716 [Zingiber officinale]|uniref:Uncharacterized protein n=1 Tax=Zingiber officinale TaxID=94328 RepID=A0A8J5GEP7_ZINOF|nr:uncharacterized protein LOC121998716 [Zingiber officinale]KAG6502327.1 hypothetical protein ZIOFF_042219 [Zingiber officinale]
MASTSVPAAALFRGASSACCSGGTLLPAGGGLRLRPHLRFAVSQPFDGRRRRSVLQFQTTRSHPFMLTRVVSRDGEGNQSTEEIIVDEQTLQRDLESAIEDEDYARAATIRDRLRLLHEDSKAAVFAANARFYRAFRNGDLASMRSIWSKGDHVYVIHPGAGRISGHDMVMGSWEIVCNADYDFPLQIDLKNVEVHVRGDVGYVTCMEVVKTKGSSWGKQVATNMFERIDGQWFICIHHASHIDD